MKILIYDDSQIDIDDLKKAIHSCMHEKAVEYEITICESREFLLNNINQFDVLFLDIELNEENGIELGLELKSCNYDTRIIITSHYTKYLIDGYKINATRYFLKPIQQSIFNVEMEEIINSTFFKFLGFTDFKISPIKIYYKDILYVEFTNRKTFLHMVSGEIFKTPYQLKAWQSKLNNFPFSQSHQAFIVNLNTISGFNKNNIILINDEMIPLSRGYKQQFENAYVKSLRKVL